MCHRCNKTKCEEIREFKKLCANKIKACHINSKKIDVKQLNADQVDVKQLNADQVDVKQLNADQVDVKQLNADQADINHINANTVCSCLVKTPSSVLGQVTSISTRDQFNPDQLLDLMASLVNNYSNGTPALLTIPKWSWTGFESVPTNVNLEKETINTGDLDDNTMVEKLLTLAFFVTYSIDPNYQFSVLSNDVRGKQINAPGRQEYPKTMNIIIQSVLDKNLPGLDDTHEISLRIAQSYNNILIAGYSDLNYNDVLGTAESLFLANLMHKNYNAVQNVSSAFYGSLVFGNWLTWNWIFFNFVPPQFLGYNDDNLEAMVQAFMANADQLKKIVQYETEGLGKYFWVRWFTDPENSQIYTFDGVDPDGYSRPEGWTLDNFRFGGLMDWEFLAESKAPFKELNVFGQALGSVFSYEDNEDFGTFGFKSFVEKIASSPEKAEEILCQMEQIWNETIAPQYAKIEELSVARRAESEDDFYSGGWRVKIPEVSKVNRTGTDVDATTISFETSFNDQPGLQVPFDSANNAGYAASQSAAFGTDDATLKALFEQYQADIAEMEKWMNIDLANTFVSKSGDEFNSIFKVDTNKGICGNTVTPATGTVPYTSIQEIIDNYAGVIEIVDDPKPLSQLVFESGFAVSQLLYDVREFTANQYVKKNFSQYDFADEASAGVCKENQSGHTVSYQEVSQDLLGLYNCAIEGDEFRRSDISGLGRQYGYEVDGVTKVPSEWNGDLTQLVYLYNADFDYIYRQHYQVDNSSPLTPGNVAPAGGEAFTKVPASEFQALEAQSLSQINSGKLGSYYRWKNDWMCQRVSGFVIDNLVTKGILNDPFATDYYKSTFVDSNGSGCTSLSHTAPETIRFRIAGQVAGSANASTDLDQETKTFTTLVRILTADPKNSPTVQNNVPLIIHECALGHGFDSVPNNIDILRGVPSEISWYSNVNNFFGPLTENQLYAYPLLGPGANILFEGWATYGELVGTQKNLVTEFDEFGCPTNEPDLVSVFNGNVLLARVGARQICCIGENFSRYAWSVYHNEDVFFNFSNIPVSVGPDFQIRFISHPMQQTSYATGLTQNVGLLAAIRAEGESRVPPCTVNDAGFNQFRITRTDYILGAPLNQIVQDNIDDFLDCP